MNYLGDYKEDDTLYFMWSTNDAGGASITRATDGTISVYKDDNDTQSVAGITDTEDFDSLTGIHSCKIVLTDAFYVTGSDYTVVLSAATIDGQVVNAVLATFSIENRFEEVTLADGAHGGSSAVVTLKNVVVNRSDAGPAVDIDSASGAAGVGAVSIRNASGHGLDCRGTGTGAFFFGATYGVELSSLGAGDALRLTGGATGAGLNASGGVGIQLAAVAGPGLQASGTTFGIEATASAGPGLSAVASAGNNDGFVATKSGSGYDINADIQGTVSGNSTHDAAAVKTAIEAGGSSLALIKAVTDVIPDSGALTTINTNTARLTAVRAAVLTDWIDGGRLDLILDAITSDTGTGARTVTVTVNDGSTALQTARVRFTKGAATYAQNTNASGNATFNLDDGTYTVSISLIGYTYSGTTQVVDGNETPTYSMTAQAITAPSDATLCTVQFRVKLSNTAVSGAVCKAKLQGINQASDGTILSNAESSDTTDSDGIAELALVQRGSIVKGSGIYRISVEIAGQPVASVETTIPNQSTYLFEDLL